MMLFQLLLVLLYSLIATTLCNTLVSFVTDPCVRRSRPLAMPPPLPTQLTRVVGGSGLVSAGN